MLILGLVAVLIGIRSWRTRGVATKSSMPMWMAAIDKFKPAKSLGGRVRADKHPRSGNPDRHLFFLGGETAAETLAELRHWLAINNAARSSPVLMGGIGAKLIGGGMQVVFA